MSLVSFATRLIVCRALAGKTFAGDRVLNSPVEPLEDLLADGAPAVPLIAVYTSDTEHKGPGRETTGDEQKVTLSLQILIPPKVNVAGIEFAARGAGAAALVDFVTRQIDRAFSVETSAWAELFRAFVVKIESTTVTPVVYEMADQSRQATRIPAADISMECKTVLEPKWGRPLAHHWLALDTAMRTEVALVPLADLLKAAIEQPDGMADWAVITAALGLSLETAQLVGIAPTPIIDTGETPVVDNIVVDPDLVVTPPVGGTP